MRWNEQAARMHAIWQSLGGSSRKVLFEQLQPPMSLDSFAQAMRPKGRKPKEAGQIITDFARLCVTKIGNARPELDSEQLAAELGTYIRLGTDNPLQNLSQADGSSPVKGSKPAVKNTGHTRNFITPDDKAKSRSFDLWTPGLSKDLVLNQFSELGPELANKVLLLSSDAIHSIAAGDFEQQLSIARSVIEIAHQTSNSTLLGEGNYLAGEALRLLADFEPDRGQAIGLRHQAVDAYSAAEEILGGDPRALRGRARTIEVLGDLDRGLKGFSEASVEIERRFFGLQEKDKLSHSHEKIRTLRHEVACKAAMRDQMPFPTIESHKHASELKDLIERSETMHAKTLHLFQGHGGWWKIEWFMAQVLHARAWASINEKTFAARRLIWALDMRLKMIPDEGRISLVELGNLSWWLSVAERVRDAFERKQQLEISSISEALQRRGDRHSIAQACRAFLSAGSAPWE